MLQIPENYTDFFYWVKERTEASWRGKPGIAIEDFEYEMDVWR